jgi:hypothetical protein
MAYRLQHSGLVWLVVGLCVGLLLSAIFPHTPLHASSNDRYDDFAIATGAVDDTTEAIYFLDFLTGDLKAAAVGPFRKFAALYQKNIRNDLGDAGKSARYLMVTGMGPDVRGSRGNARPSAAMLYVANCANGRIGAYNFAWDKNAITAGRTIIGQPIILMDIFQARTAVIAPGAKP